MLQDHNVTTNTLREYERNKPIADYLTATKRELEKVKKERDSYKIDLEHERFWKRKEEQYTWSVLATEIDKANRDLGFGTNSHLDAGNLKDMMMDVYYHPSKYVQVIIQMMNTYNLEYKQEEKQLSKSSNDDNHALIFSGSKHRPPDKK